MHPVFVPETGNTYDKEPLFRFWRSLVRKSMNVKDPLTNVELKSSKVHVNWGKRREIVQFLEKYPDMKPTGWEVSDVNRKLTSFSEFLTESQVEQHNGFSLETLRKNIFISVFTCVILFQAYSKSQRSRAKISKDLLLYRAYKQFRVYVERTDLSKNSTRIAIEILPRSIFDMSVLMQGGFSLLWLNIQILWFRRNRFKTKLVLSSLPVFFLTLYILKHPVWSVLQTTVITLKPLVSDDQNTIVTVTKYLLNFMSFECSFIVKDSSQVFLEESSRIGFETSFGYIGEYLKITDQRRVLALLKRVFDRKFVCR